MKVTKKISVIFVLLFTGKWYQNIVPSLSNYTYSLILSYTRFMKERMLLYSAEF